MVHLTIPILAVALAVPILFRKKSRPHSYGLSSIFCDAWTVASSLVAIIAWSVNDLHFDGSKKLALSSDINDGCSTGGTCLVDDASAYGWGDRPDDRAHPSIAEVSEDISLHCGVASMMLGTAAILELFHVIAHRILTRRMHREEEENRRVGNSIYVLFGLHDSECLLFVYTLLFFTHAFISADRGSGISWVMFADPVSAAAGIYRPISTLRCIEWSIASPALMSLVGRSFPRREALDPETLRPALLLTVSYVFLAWLALPIVNPFWRWTLIFFSFMG